MLGTAATLCKPQADVPHNRSSTKTQQNQYSCVRCCLRCCVHWRLTIRLVVEQALRRKARHCLMHKHFSGRSHPAMLRPLLSERCLGCPDGVARLRDDRRVYGCTEHFVRQILTGWSRFGAQMLRAISEPLRARQAPRRGDKTFSGHCHCSTATDTIPRCSQSLHAMLGTAATLRNCTHQADSPHNRSSTAISNVGALACAAACTGGSRTDR